MKNNFLRIIFVLFFTIFPSCANAIFSQTVAPENSQIGQIKISGNVLATMKNGDYVYPKFSPDGKRLAYSNVLVGKMENTEVGLFDLQKQTKSILLNSKEAEKYAVYAAFVADLEWLALNRLRARISDGDVDSTILTFNTQTRRVIKTEESSGDSDFENIPSKTSPLAKILYKRFPNIERDFIGAAVDRGQVFKIGNRGTVIRYPHARADSNIWFLDFQTRKQILLIENPPTSDHLFLKGALEVNGNLLLIVEGNNEIRFYRRRDGKTEQIGKTAFGGDFEPKFSAPSRAFFLLKEPNNESEKPSSLWYFDGENLKRVSDVENLCDVDIDKIGRMIAFSYWNKAGKRDVSVRKIKADF